MTGLACVTGLESAKSIRGGSDFGAAFGFRPGEPITFVTLLGIALTAWGVSWVIRAPKVKESN